MTAPVGLGSGETAAGIHTVSQLVNSRERILMIMIVIIIIIVRNIYNVLTKHQKLFSQFLTCTKPFSKIPSPLE